jgi:hypothetical protein
MEKKKISELEVVAIETIQLKHREKGFEVYVGRQ